jgi:hypothetical protein
MRILLDECVNQRLRTYLQGHECQSAQYAGFSGQDCLLDAETLVWGAVAYNRVFARYAAQKFPMAH